MSNQKVFKKQTKKIVCYDKDIFSSIKQRIEAQDKGATVFVPHVCNNIDLFGAGFAAAVASHYPEVKTNYHLLGKNFLSNNFGYSQILMVDEEPKYRHKLFFVNMIAQNGVKGYNNPRPLNYFALSQSMYKLSHFIHKNFNNINDVEIHCPKFGSGLAGGNWEFISDLIDDIWAKFFVMIYNPTK